MTGESAIERKPGKGRREGRGQLSSIDLLPEDAEPDLVWALEELRERRMPSQMILKEFNARLADKGIKGISKSAWGRYSVRKALHFRSMDQEHRIMSELRKAIGTDAPEDMTMVLGEMLKIQVFQNLEGGTLGGKELGAMARVLRNAVQAQADTLEVKNMLADMKERIDRAAAAIASEGAKTGIKPDALKKITNLLTTGAA